jgi:hypothetical protein
MEHVIHSSVLTHLENTNILSDEQHGCGLCVPGLLLEDWPLSPFLNTGATIAVFQSDGNLLWLMDAWNINVSAGVISFFLTQFSPLNVIVIINIYH